MTADAKPKDEGETKSPSFLQTLKNYKEFITILVFFFGGVLWILGYFATKKQVDDVRCLLNANVDFIQGKIDAASLSQLLIQNYDQTKGITNKGVLTQDEKQKRAQLDTAAQEISRKLALAQDASTQALDKLRKGGCSS
jgi:hypothetical protein